MTDRVVSLGTMIKQLAGLTLGDLSEWEQQFVENVCNRTRDGHDTTRLSDRQTEIVEQIYRKHFA
jgi:hypothetical protein